jgi:hypothetical protein
MDRPALLRRLSSLRRLCRLPAGRAWLLALATALVVTGCLPSACEREGYDAVAPADSLSRRVAQQTTVDTIRKAWQSLGPGDNPLQFPRTVRYLPDGRLVSSDAERNALYWHTPAGSLTTALADDRFEVPYVIGTWGADTLVVLNPGTDRVEVVAGQQVAPDLGFDFQRPSEEALVYGAATARGACRRRPGSKGRSGAMPAAWPCGATPWPASPASSPPSTSCRWASKTMPSPTRCVSWASTRPCCRAPSPTARATSRSRPF